MRGETAGLPGWRDRSTNLKTGELVEPGPAPEWVIGDFLLRTAAEMCKEPGSLRILDFGCGRGSLVSWLLANGWDAWGLDVSEEYIESGDSLTRRLGGNLQRLKVINGDGVPFDEPFDVVLSVEVLEHVMDLDSFTSAVASAGRPGSRGLHVFPAKWSPIEVHMRLPIVHWLPKGPLRESTIRLMLRTGLGVDYFSDYPVSERAVIFSRFSEQETDYKGLRRLRNAFGVAGMECDFGSVATAKVKRKAPWLPGPAAAAAAGAYSRFHATYLTTTQVS